MTGFEEDLSDIEPGHEDVIVHHDAKDCPVEPGGHNTQKDTATPHNTYRSNTQVLLADPNAPKPSEPVNRKMKEERKKKAREERRERMRKIRRMH